jgi:hypothetical protein
MERILRKGPGEIDAAKAQLKALRQIAATCQPAARLNRHHRAWRACSGWKRR